MPHSAAACALDKDHNDDKEERGIAVFIDSIQIRIRNQQQKNNYDMIKPHTIPAPVSYTLLLTSVVEGVDRSDWRKEFDDVIVAEHCSNVRRC